MMKYQTGMINRIAFVLALCWLLLIGWTLDQKTDDFARFWQASYDFIHYGNPYVTQEDYFYPPLFIYLIQPFGLLSHQLGQWIWFVFNSIMLTGFILVCIRLSGSVYAHRYWGIVVLGVLITPPARLSLQLGQVSIVIALMIIGCYGLARTSPALAGSFLALASHMRIHPAFLGIYYLLRRPRHVAWWYIAMSVALLLLAILWYGSAPYQNYILTIVQPNIVRQGVYPYAAEHNISFFGFWYRIFTANRFSVPLADVPSVAKTLTLITSLAFSGLCWWVGRDDYDQHLAALQFSVWVCGMMVLFPTNGYYNLVILLFPILLIVRFLEEEYHRHILTWLVIATALVCIPPGWTNAHPVLYQMMHMRWGLLLLTPSLYGIGVFMGLLIVLIQHKRRYQHEQLV